MVKKNIFVNFKVVISSITINTTQILPGYNFLKRRVRPVLLDDVEEPVVEVLLVGRSEKSTNNYKCLFLLEKNHYQFLERSGERRIHS